MAASGVPSQTLSITFTSKFVILLIFITNLTTATKKYPLKLKMVQILIRHGDRTPIETYANDKWKNAWPEGWGQLTRVGMQQQYNTGLYLRKRYESLVNDTEDYNVIYMRSTDLNRNVMSASFNLAGFLQPEGTDKLKENICWEPIPIHRVPIKHDHLLSYFSDCPEFLKLQKDLFEFSNIMNFFSKHRHLVALITNKLGLSVREIFKIYIFTDSIFVQKFHNLDLPEWVNDTVLADMRELAIDFFLFLVKTPEIRRIRGGPLLGEMIKKMETVIDARSGRHKIYTYLAHDTTIITLLSALDILYPHVPTYCSTIMVELLQGGGNYYVKIFQRNDMTREPRELSLKGCSSPCPFETFKQLTLPMIPNDIESECFP